MKLHRVMAVALVGLSPFLLGACGGGSEGVTQASPGPRFPGVGGNWRGTWTVSGSELQATLAVTQTGDQLRGTLTVGMEENEITGVVNQSGVVEFEGTETEAGGGCIVYYTRRPHMALSEQGSELGGPLSRLFFDCDNRDSGFITGGVLELDKIL